MNFISIIYDIEVFPNKFCIGLKVGQKKPIVWDDLDEIKKLNFQDFHYRWIGFNNRRYDQLLLEAVKAGNSHDQLYQLSQKIINNEIQDKVWNPYLIDLYEIFPGSVYNRGSLKEFGHRLGYPVLANLPYPYNQVLTNSEWEKVKAYCLHDINITAQLWEKLKPTYNTRAKLGKLFNIRSFHYGGSPNLAQKCILTRLGSNRISDQTEPLFKQNNLQLPPQLASYYDILFSLPVKSYKEDKTPDFLDKNINWNSYNLKIGIGGLHLLAQTGVFKAAYQYDVMSYYPSIILQCKLGSPKFLDIFQKIYDNRLVAKANKDVLESAALKLVLNALIGKMDGKNKYPVHPQIYAPNVALSTRLLGQFYILDLINKLNPRHVISANTDDVVLTQPIPEDILQEWQQRTGFTLSLTTFRPYICNHINCKYGITTDGKEVATSIFRQRDWQHNANAVAITQLVLSKLFNKLVTLRPIDFCFFSKIIKKPDYFIYNDNKLEDKRIRYYASTKGKWLKRVTSKKTSLVISDSPVTLSMNLSRTLPNLNLNWYIEKANKLVADLLKKDQSQVALMKFNYRLLET